MPFALLALCLAAAPAPTTTEPGTRLLPFGEDLPDRGPMGALSPPPLRLSDLSLQTLPPAELTDEERAVLLRRAKLTHGEGGFFGSGPKDPWRAVALSAEAMALSAVFPPLWIIAGSVGQAYAGNWLEAALMSSTRFVFGIWILVEAVALLNTLSTPSTLNAVQSAANNFDLAMALGGSVILASNAVDLLTVFGVAKRANERWEDQALSQVGVAVSPAAGGNGATVDGVVRF
jgi:hypothetical protein